MKKTFAFLMVVAMCAAGSVSAMRPPDAATGHMLYDGVDLVWYCVGSPKDCDF